MQQNTKNQRLADEIAKHIGDAGTVLRADYRGPGWTVVLSTEFAALRAFYKYKGCKGARIGIAHEPAGWYLSVE